MKVCFLLCLFPLASTGQTLFDLAPDLSQETRFPATSSAALNLKPDGSPTPALPQGRNFFFGDSLSDTGNVADFLDTLGLGYPGNSFTNGPTWVEYLQPDIRRLLENLQSSPDQASLDLSESLDFSAGGATTSTVLNQQIQNLFLPASDLLTPRPSDRAFIWAGGNDFLPFLSNNSLPDQVIFEATIATAVSNLTNIVAALDATGLPKITVISLLDFSLTPRGQGLSFDGATSSRLFNSQLKQNLRSLPISANLLWIDSGAFLNQAAATPTAYGFTNVIDAAAPLASDGVPSILSTEEQAGYLFYDDIHPTTETHRQFGLFVSEHLGLESDALDLALLTDSALLLESRFGFDFAPLTAGKSEFNVTTFLTENEIGPRRRQTSGVKADYAYALSDHFLLGGEFFHAEGDSGRSSLEALGAGLDALYRGSFLNLQWEAGLGAGLTWGDLTRRSLTPGFRAVSDQQATTFSVHAALANRNWTIGPLKASWEIGLKQRTVHRHSSEESGAASLNLQYESETLSATIANLELGLNLLPNLNLQLALNPVLFHHGGEITASQRDGLATFTTADRSGFDIHTARTSLILSPNETVKITTDFIIGFSQLWSTNLSFRLQF